MSNTILERLLAGLEAGRLSHAYIFEGERSLTEPAARTFAKALLCTGEGHKPCGRCSSCRNLQNGIEEDLVVLAGTSSGKSGNMSLKDDQVEEMQERLKTKPLAAERVVALILDADLLTERAQNRLLKTLEEPPGRDALILLSGNTEHLLPTILSRCTTLHFGEGQAEETEAELAAKELADRYLNILVRERAANDRSPEPRYYEFLPLLKEVTEDKPTADRFLDALEEQIPDLDWAYAIEDARRDLARNVSVSYAMKWLTIKLIS